MTPLSAPKHHLPITREPETKRGGTDMEKYITGERTGLRYELIGDIYYLAGNDQPEEEKSEPEKEPEPKY